VNPLDYLVLFSTMLGIAAYGVWRTRGQRGLSGYLKGSGTTGWVTIGLSVMATQARGMRTGWVLCRIILGCRWP
jgi:Na+/proline symporter